LHRPGSGSLLYQKLEVKREMCGIDIPCLRASTCGKEYNLFLTPLWVDKVLELLKEQLALWPIHILEIQRELIGNELRITSQRVNLFEKVKIVEAKENIRIIRIYLGDQQTAAVVRGKISKKKIAGRT
jgi:V/A-type H+-transporting ATPase subunit D